MEAFPSFIILQSMNNRNIQNAYLIGGGIGSLSAAAFLIRDGNLRGDQIHILEGLSVMGGSLDGTGNPEKGYSLRGGRMLTTDNYECTWDLFKTIPSLGSPEISVYDETIAFNQVHKSHAMARLINKHRATMPVVSMGFSMKDRVELLKLAHAEEETLGSTIITEHLSPNFFESEFWFMWSTTFAFQPWHSAVEFKRYLLRFIKEFSRIETLGGVKRTIYNQFDSLVRPLQSWLIDQGLHLITNCQVTDIIHEEIENQFRVTDLVMCRNGVEEGIVIHPEDLVFLQNGSMTDASSLGSMTQPAPRLTKSRSLNWTLWEKLAEGRPHFGNPAAFNSNIAQSNWQSFTVTLKNPLFFDLMNQMSGNEAGTGGLVTFKDSNWMMSVVLAHQPHFIDQPKEIQVFWGYSLFPDRIGNFVAKPMSECNGKEILEELAGHLRFDIEIWESANCIPCIMPYITSMFMPRSATDRPLPVPPCSKNFAFISQFVEIPNDVVFTVEYSIRAAQMAVYELLGIDRIIPPVTRHDKTFQVQFEALLKAFA